MRIEDALGRFTTQLEADGRSLHTIRQYGRHVRLLAHWAHDVATCGGEVEKLGHEDVARFLAAPVATGRTGGGIKKATSANCLRSSIRNFLTHCHRAGYVPLDPGRLIRRARCSPPPPRGLSDDEQSNLLDALSKAEGAESRRDHALIHLMLAAGIRIGSAIALDVEDVDLGAGQISVRKAKNDAPDVFYLNDKIKAHIGTFLAGRTTGAVFLANGHRVSQRHVQRRFGQWILKAGIATKASPHSLRHNAESWIMPSSAVNRWGFGGALAA